MPAEFENGLFVGEGAWHNLGTVVPADSPIRFNARECMIKAGAAFDVEKEPTFVEIDGNRVATGHFAIVRSDTRAVIGNVGARYAPLQNEAQYDWFQPFLDTREVSIETCGVLRGGAITWALAKILRDPCKVSDGDTVQKYLQLYSSHDGSLATGVGFFPVRTVCMNTLAMNLSSTAKKALKVRHTERQVRTLEQIREIINVADREFEATAAQYRELLSAGIDARDLRRYVKLVFEAPEDEEAISTRLKNIIERCETLAVEGKGQEGILTAWSAYNGVTQYLTHERGRSAENRAYANSWGVGKSLNDRAFSLAMQLAS